MSSPSLRCVGLRCVGLRCVGLRCVGLRRVGVLSPLVLVLCAAVAGTGCNGSLAGGQTSAGAKPGVLYLARHGQTAWNRVSRFQGDPDLDAVGYLNRLDLWLLLKDEPLVAIFTSDKQRTQRTAALVARQRGLPIQARKELSEIAAGVLEGICYLHLAPRHARPSAKECDVPARGSRPARARAAAQAIWEKVLREGNAGSVPLGESYLDLVARSKPLLPDLRAALARGNVLVVGHGVINRIVLHHLLGWSLEQVGKLRQGNDQVWRIEGLHDSQRQVGGKRRVRGKRHVWLHTPGYGWKRCSPPRPGQRHLDCNPGPERTLARPERTPASRPTKAPAVP